MTDKPLISPLNWTLGALLVAIVLVGFVVVPLEKSLPIHWDIAGQPDRFAPAPLALLLPAVLAAVGLVILALIRRVREGRAYAAGRHAIDAAITMIVALAAVLAAATVAIGIGLAIDMPRLIVFFLGTLVLVLGNYLPKTQPNALAGLRLRSTMADIRNWQVTHRWLGRLMMLGGLVAVLAASVGLPTPVLLAVMLAAILLPLLAGLVISLRLAKGQR